MPQILTFTVRDQPTIRDAILRVVRNGLIARGVANPNVTPGSDWYLIASAVADQLAVVEANAVIKADEAMPDSADDDEENDVRALTRICELYDIRKQSPAGSAGPGILRSSATTTISTGAQLLDGTGLRYRLAVGGTFGNGATLSIEAVDAGAATNLEEGAVLRWVSTPPFCDEKVTVGAGGLRNGHDGETTEGMRLRLYDRLRQPPRSGNAQHVVELAEEASPAVQKAVCYPAVQGPSTVHVAVTATPTATNKSRDVAAATMNATVRPYVQGQLPEHAHVVVTTVENVDADVVFGLSLPEARTASPPGPGGGWVNGTPWPFVDAATTWRTTVTAVVSSTQFTVDAPAPPVDGVTRVAWLSPLDWKLYTALVVSHTGSSGAYEITLDRAFVGVMVGAYIWPECVNAQRYVDAVMEAFALMGPGEKSANPSALRRGFRHPRPGASWPYTLGTHLPGALTASAPGVVATALFFHRFANGVATLGNAGAVPPPVPVDIEGKPRIFRPRHIAFMRIP